MHEHNDCIKCNIKLQVIMVSYLWLVCFRKIIISGAVKMQSLLSFLLKFMKINFSGLHAGHVLQTILDGSKTLVSKQTR